VESALVQEIDFPFFFNFYRFPTIRDRRKQILMFSIPDAIESSVILDSRLFQRKSVKLAARMGNGAWGMGQGAMGNEN
jgi:hypothetical protein